jgi:uncharacterized damage-inducible protein DinB
MTRQRLPARLLEVRRTLRPHDRRAHKLVERLGETIAFTFVGGGTGRLTRGGSLLHLVNHTSYRRGFVADLFLQVPAHPPATDLRVVLRDVPLELGA